MLIHGGQHSVARFGGVPGSAGRHVMFVQSKKPGDWRSEWAGMVNIRRGRRECMRNLVGPKRERGGMDGRR